MHRIGVARLRQLVPPGAKVAIAPVAELFGLWAGGAGAPWHAYDYARVWVSPEGREYRQTVYERQREGGSRPLTSDPSPDQMRRALRALAPRSVLEIGCGWGRMLEHLRGEPYTVAGCDVSDDMLALCPPDVPTFRLDIVADGEYCRANAGRWDALWTRGVMLHFMADPAQMRLAMRNLHTLASRAIVIWEWPEVCAQMRRINRSPKFRYRPVAHSDG